MCDGLNTLFDFGKTDGAGKCGLTECGIRPNINNISLQQSLLIHMYIWQTSKTIPKLFILQQTACEG